MKHHLCQLLSQAVQTLKSRGVLPDEARIKINLERTRDRKHGDFASNLAMVLCKVARSKPRDLAEQLVSALPESEQLSKIEIAGPGFINFFFTPNYVNKLIGYENPKFVSFNLPFQPLVNIFTYKDMKYYPSTT